MATWSRIWQQATTRSLGAMQTGTNKTVAFSIASPVKAEKLRIRFTNIFGEAPYRIDDMALFAGGAFVPVTVGGRRAFEVGVGSRVCSDELELPVEQGGCVEVRMHYLDAIADCNMIEQGATQLSGNQVWTGLSTMRKPFLVQLLGAYNAVPGIQAVEVLSEAPAKAIVAFGDSITALSQWTKPLAARLAEAYPGEYALLNAGISGNCLLYEPGGFFGPVFGQKGTVRFKRDVLDVPNLDTVIFGLGVNDVSYYTENTADQINLEAFKQAITAQVQELRGRGVRVAMQTITPRLGVALTMGRYYPAMEEQRLLFNDWLRSADIFDYLFDAEAVVREERADGYYYREGLHQGDHLHPNAAGGELLANAFDLAKLTGKE